MNPDLAQYNRVLLYGGSFDPPHRAHLELPELARQAVGADIVLYIPAAKAPHKLDRQQTSAKHRLAMLQLALQDQPNAAISTIELDRFEADPDTPSYTVDTLEALHAQLKAASCQTKLRLLMGTDQLAIFDQWKSPGRIVELAEPAVMLRSTSDDASLDREQALAVLPAEEREVWAKRLLNVPQIVMSSTDIREQAANPSKMSSTGLTSRSVTSRALTSAVQAYIDEHQLYH